MAFDDLGGGFYGGVTVAEPTPAPQQTAEPTVEDLLRGMLAKELTAYASGDTGTTGGTTYTDEETGMVFSIPGTQGPSPLDRVLDITLAADRLGLDLGIGGGSAGTSTALSANTLAQIAQQDRQLAESMRQFDITEARGAREFTETLAQQRALQAQADEAAIARQREEIASQERRAAAALAEQQRGNNLSSVLDMLTNQIRVGELGVNEATNRITAATQAANIQRDILADHAGRALPAGTTVFPNLGASGPIAAMAAALGQPFRPFETLGTFAIDPNAIAAPISNAPGASQLPGVNSALAAAAAALAGMGVPNVGLPPNTPQEAAMRPPQIGQQAAAKALAGV